jgi:hypothetical protein
MNFILRNIGPGNILTVADDLLKNDGQKFLEMMEQLAERRMQREEEAAADVEDDSLVDGDEEDEEEEEEEEDEEDEEEVRHHKFPAVAASMPHGNSAGND